MRTQPDKPQYFVIRLRVDQHQIGPDMAIAMAFPIAAQRMIAVAFGERLVGLQDRKYFAEQGIERPAMPPPHFAAVVAFEAVGPFNRPH